MSAHKGLGAAQGLAHDHHRKPPVHATKPVPNLVILSKAVSELRRFRSRLGSGFPRPQRTRVKLRMSTGGPTGSCERAEKLTFLPESRSPVAPHMAAARTAGQMSSPNIYPTTNTPTTKAVPGTVTTLFWTGSSTPVHSISNLVTATVAIPTTKRRKPRIGTEPKRKKLVTIASRPDANNRRWRFRWSISAGPSMSATAGATWRLYQFWQSVDRWCQSSSSNSLTTGLTVVWVLFDPAAEA